MKVRVYWCRVALILTRPLCGHLTHR